MVHKIERMLGGSTFFSMDSGRVGDPAGSGEYSFSISAVLYRTEAQSERLREALARSGMPFQQRSDRRLAERAGSAGARAGSSLAPSPGPLAARLKAAAARLREEVAQPGLAGAPPAAGGGRGGRAVPRRGRRGRGAGAASRRSRSAAGGDLDRFLIELAVGTEIDAWDPRADRISLLTLHAAKGLEFRVVFLVGCEDASLRSASPAGRDGRRRGAPALL